MPTFPLLGRTFFSSHATVSSISVLSSVCPARDGRCVDAYRRSFPEIESALAHPGRQRYSLHGRTREPDPIGDDNFFSIGRHAERGALDEEGIRFLFIPGNVHLREQRYTVAHGNAEFVLEKTCFGLTSGIGADTDPPCCTGDQQQQSRRRRQFAETSSH